MNVHAVKIYILNGSYKKCFKYYTCDGIRIMNHRYLCKWYSLWIMKPMASIPLFCFILRDDKIRYILLYHLGFRTYYRCVELYHDNIYADKHWFLSLHFCGSLVSVWHCRLNMFTLVIYFVRIRYSWIYNTPFLSSLSYSVFQCFLKYFTAYNIFSSPNMHV